MHAISAAYPGPLPVAAFGVALPDDMNVAIVEQLPLQSMVVLAQVSGALSQALRLPGEIAAVFAALRAAQSTEEMANSFNMIPDEPSYLRAAMIRAFSERVIEKSYNRARALRHEIVLAQCDTGLKLKAECVGARHDTGERDLLIASIFLSMLIYDNAELSQHRATEIACQFEEKLSTLPKWCWPDVIIALDKTVGLMARACDEEIRYVGVRDIAPHRQFGPVSLLIDHLDDLDRHLPVSLQGALALAWLKRGDVDIVCQRLMQKFAQGDGHRHALESSLTDALRGAIHGKPLTLREILPRWDSDITALVETLHRKLIVDTALFRCLTKWGATFHKSEDLWPSVEASLPSWVFGVDAASVKRMFPSVNSALSFWEIYYTSPNGLAEVRIQIDRILTLPWELQPTLFNRCAEQTLHSDDIVTAGFPLSDWLQKAVDRSIGEARFDLTVRALMLPVNIFYNSLLCQRNGIPALANAIERSQAMIPPRHWGEVVEQVIFSLANSATVWPGEDDRLAYLEAFFSAEDGAWAMPVKALLFVPYVVEMWGRLPDRSTVEVSRFDAFCAQFTLDRESVKKLKQALGV